ncbi:MAG TPA: GTP cyclohydrolase II RibA [Alphaproteobacteria bacterium]|nr:GTP cyclohydrolase II RibA [Alphaproteobacteria bacterium]
MLDQFSGDNAALIVHRVLADFRAGAPVLLRDGAQADIALTVEGLDERALAALRAARQPISLAVTATRAASLGAPANGAMMMPLAEDITAARIQELAGAPATKLAAPLHPAAPTATAALELAKLAQMLPAALIVPEPARAILPASGEAEAADVMHFRAAATRSMRLVSRARVPLHKNLSTEFVIFRDMLGRNMTAVVVGTPDFTKAVPVRLHSCCLTGDVFASRRCDCGDQLQMSMEILSDKGGGVLLYLDQEGCGIGLANKMRAYGLQDRGLDTIDANTTLGFATDERRYDGAARMLELLGIGRVQLLTNNPAKLSGLADYGIEIAGRIPLIAPVNATNRRYLDAKAKRAGHMLEDLNEPALKVHSRA